MQRQLLGKHRSSSVEGLHEESMAFDGSWVLTGTQKGKCSTAQPIEVFSCLEKNSKFGGDEQEKIAE
ncbi:hypothetical protein HGM15179_009629 [Zosterops borbonicus]|uniref:Uncharacterized protein n=1 Tax=Zosterops borbonicus TaxID=364589 RepID=A0A8K1GG30_9PASS|nr:hypothetical protein HGM15179_009629 [Zosterops borbonicus]